jgi:hypothetical protein
LRKHWLYGLYVARHKWYVLLAGLRRGVNPWQLIVHDLSKFRPDEWRPYAEWFYGANGGPWAPLLRDPSEAWREEAAVRQRAFQRAFLAHLHRNPHHQQHYVLPSQGDKPPVVFEIPERYVREMLADWDGAGRAISGVVDCRDWYVRETLAGRILLHPATRDRVDQLLGVQITPAGTALP